MKPKKKRKSLSCPKCDNKDISTTYHRGDTECAYGSDNEMIKEHLHRYCRNCSYDWCDKVITELTQ